MNRRILKLGLMVGLGCSLASANVSWTWSFGGTTSSSQDVQVTNGTLATVSSGTVATGQTLAPYGVQEVTPVSPSTSGAISTTAAETNTLSGLFYVNQYPNNRGTGIAPYNPSETTSSYFGSQMGITNNVDNPTSETPGTYQNLVLLKFDGSGVSANETLSFLLQAGDPGYAFNVLTYYGPAMPTNINQFTVAASAVCVDSGATPSPACAGGNDLPTTAQASINTGANTGTLWVAIQGDCQYLLLDTVSGSTAAAPEPRFYGMLLAGLLAVAVTLRRRFVTA